MKASGETALKSSYECLRVAVLAAAPTTGVVGGAERLYEGLLNGLRQIGCQAELISIPADEPNFEAIMGNYDRCEALDVSGFDIVISTKAPTYAVRHPRHILYLVHTVRVFDDMFERVFPKAMPETYRQRARIHARDFNAMTQVKARFAIGHEVAGRLYRWRGLDAEVLHPPLGVTGFQCAAASDYFFLPGRLHDWKRVHLVIEAVRYSSRPMRLLIAGTGEAEAKLKALAAGDPRIEFLGRVDDAELIELYSRALAVPFVPEREDYGYITLEAFASGKPVVTCVDSGEPARVVIDGVSGRVCKPEPKEICKALEFLFDNPRRAEQMGQNGLAWIAGMNWTDVAQKLVHAALAPKEDKAPHKLKVTVLDMQPIDPPVGGGRLRLLGLYHNLGDEIDCTYIGSYDWPGESYRRHRLSPGLEEIDIPLSREHHAEAGRLSAQAGGKTVIDISFGRKGHLSVDYVQAAREAVRESDVVVFSHPWVYPLLEADLRPGQIIVYDSHNVEGFLRAQLLDENNALEAELLHGVVEDELRLCQRADLVLACSQEDALRFNRLYRIRANKLRVVPNGVMAFAHPVPKPADRLAAKKRLGIEQWRLVAIFIGSAYAPNVDAARFIVTQLAPRSTDTLFVIAGGVGSQIASTHENVHITGQLEEAIKIEWLTAADVAVNPMFSGSGTNIKMFDFMAFGLPTITTETGARGITKNASDAIAVVAANESAFTESLDQLKNSKLRGDRGDKARICVEQYYSWERISRHTGRLLKAYSRYVLQPLPRFTVLVVASGDIDDLGPLYLSLNRQTERDFELIVVDRAPAPRSDQLQGGAFPSMYIHCPHLGSGAAKNAGESLSNGTVLVLAQERDVLDETWLFQLRESSTMADGHAETVAWVPASYEGAGAALPRLAVRLEALRIAGGFEDDAMINDLADSDRLLARLRRLGRVAAAPSLETPVLLKDARCALVMLSTQGHKCGVGEYAASLEKALKKKGMAVHVLSCRSETSGVMLGGAGRGAHIGWYYDDKSFVHSFIFPETAALIRATGASRVVIQYHPAFFPTAELMRFVKECVENRWRVIIDNHRFRVEDVPVFVEMGAMGAVVLLHKQAECIAAKQLGLDAVYSPIGLESQIPDPPKSINGRDWNKSPPTLVTTGFIRPHKGVRALIKAMPAIQLEFPGAVLRIHCAEYPSEDSREELARCRAMVDAMGLNAFVAFDSAFHEKSEQLANIRDADLAILAYDQSEEGGSAAAADCLSVGLPLLVSRASIFDDVREYALTVEGDASAWAQAIADVLRSGDKYAALCECSVAYAKKHDWDRAADHFVAVE